LNRIQLFTREFWLARWESPVCRGALLVLATVLVYLPATHCGYIWDDDVYVTGNPLLTAPDGLWRIWFSFDSPSQYFPLVYTTMRLEHGLWGLAPFGYHCVNIILHAVNGLLLWRLLLRMEIPGAWFAAAIFAVHPVQVESVAWVTELKNVEMGFFFLLALIAWTGFIEGQHGRAWGYYWLALALYALALFSKTTACTMPAALLIICWLRGQRIRWRRIGEIVPFGLMGVGMGLLTVWWERYHQGTQGALFTIGLPERVLIAGRGVWFYLDKLIWPATLTFSYPHWTLSAGDVTAWYWLDWVCIFGLVTFLGREVIGRGVFAGFAFFVAMLGPVLGFLMLYTFRYTFVADHYQYLACIGPIALVCGGGATLAEHYPRIRSAMGALAGLTILTLGVLTWKQCHIYRNDESIWRDTLIKNPGSLMAHYNLANELMRDGRFAESLEHYNRAVEIDPAFFEARCNRADLLAHVGRSREAAADYEEAVKIEPNNAGVQNGYGMVLEKLGRGAEAVAHLQEAARLEPNAPIAEKNLADALERGGDLTGALPHYQALERLFPDEAGAHVALGHVDVALNKLPGAVREYREAVRLAPQSAEALTRLAWLLARGGDAELRNSKEAVALAERACDLTHHENGVALDTLAGAYAADGRKDEAVATWRLAIDAAKRTGDEASVAEFQKELEGYEKSASGK
jgi:tetratricopeptide (TPR) repeat protein